MIVSSTCMRSGFLKASLGVIFAVGFGQQLASANVITLTSGVEVVETFSSQTPSYQFVIQNALGIGFSMAFGGTDQYQITFAPGPNSGLGTFPTTITRSGGTSTFINGSISAGAGFTSGSLDITVTDLAPSGNSLAGFVYSTPPAITLPIPVAAVPGPTVGAGASSFALAALFLGWLVRRRGHVAV